MKVLKSIAFAFILTLIMSTSCNNKSKAVDPIDSTKLVAPGIAKQIVLKSGIFLDTGMVVTVKGRGFDKTFIKDYFLIARNGGEELRQTDISEDILGNVVRDSKLTTLNDSVIEFFIPKHSVSNNNNDSVNLYFTKLRRQGVYNTSPGVISVIVDIGLAVRKPSLPIYKLLKDTLYLTKNYSIPNKGMILSSYYDNSVKAVINGIEYSNASGFYNTIRDNSSTDYFNTTISMTATKYNFVMPDGWYTFELSERYGSLRKIVEETGKTKIYIKNEQ